MSKVKANAVEEIGRHAPIFRSEILSFEPKPSSRADDKPLKVALPLLGEQGLIKNAPLDNLELTDAGRKKANRL